MTSLGDSSALSQYNYIWELDVPPSYEIDRAQTCIIEILIQYKPLTGKLYETTESSPSHTIIPSRVSIIPSKKIPAEFFFDGINDTEYGIPAEFRKNSVLTEYGIPQYRIPYSVFRIQ